MPGSDTLAVYRSRFPAGAASVQSPSVEPPHEEVRMRLAEVQRLAGLEAEGRRNVEAARTAVTAARERDAKVLADAVRAEAPAPKSGLEDRAQEALKIAERRFEALERAASDSHGELLAAVATHRGEMEQALDAQAGDLLAEAGELLAAATSKLARRGQVIQTKRWVADPHRQGGAPKSRTLSAVAEAQKALDEDARPVERNESPNWWTQQRRFDIRKREIETQLIADGRDPADAPGEAYEIARAEFEPEGAKKGPQLPIPRDGVYPPPVDQLPEVPA